MPEYPYGRIKKLAESLENAGVPEEIIDHIMVGGEMIRQSTDPVKKADWMRGAMQRMDSLLDPETRFAVREACACCLGGKRLELSKAIAKNNATLEARIQAANETSFVFGDGVEQKEDGRILVRFAPENQGPYRCVCMPKSQQPISITYCYCCGGHIKHHLQIALGRRLKMEARSSALSSGGAQACTFLFTLIDQTAN